MMRQSSVEQFKVWHEYDHDHLDCKEAVLEPRPILGRLGALATVGAIGAGILPCPPSSLSAQTASALTPTNSWSYSASAAIKETYDSNVYLQSETDLANQSSFVTTLLPQAGGSWKPDPLFNASLNYAPEISFYHAEPSEDFVLQRATLQLAGTGGPTSYDSVNNIVAINGSSVGPTWTGPGGAPATGGPAVRDRRDAAVYRSNLRLTQAFEEWFVRPTASFYLHDFQTDHRSTPGYQNYVDRKEWNGGADVGYRFDNAVVVAMGYRYGAQDQAQLLDFPEEYDNHYHRVLALLEGKPLEWLKVALVVGPEFRRYDPDKVPAAFGDPDELNLFVDGSVTVTPHPAHTISASVKQFEQPGFGGRSAYEDLSYNLTWRYKLSPRWTAGAGARAYNTDFLEPVVRNDWVLSGNVLLNWVLTPELSAEASYVYEDGQTRDQNASGREYSRHLVALGLKYQFRRL